MSMSMSMTSLLLILDGPIKREEKQRLRTPLSRYFTWRPLLRPRYLHPCHPSSPPSPSPPPPPGMGGAQFLGDNDVAARDGEAADRRDVGKMEHGCEHYRRRCKIVAPCCNQVFPCRHCHNEATASGDRHTICRQDVKKVVCLLCETEQPVSQVCISCGVNMGEYFCDICKFYDDDTEKGQYHCNDCGICRVGGKENFFHCVKCGSCYSVVLRDNHQCVENSMRQNCPICYEYLFDSLQGTRVLNCGHTMHLTCFEEMVEHNKYTCPICSKTALDLTRHWEMLDQEIEATIMPPVYRYKIWVLCNDCNKVSEVNFHVIGHKCSHCSSYNTRSTSRPADSSGSSSPSTDSSDNNM